MSQQQRNFVLKAPHDRLPILRRGLNSLGGDYAVSIKFERDEYIEFSCLNPGYAILKIKILSPASIVRERKNGLEVDVQDATPEWVGDLLSCPNKNCITGQPKEPTKRKFRVVSTNPPKIQCYFCGRYVDPATLDGQLTK
jgi:aspartate carbamoyltransferase regulatory subunit